MVLTSKQMRVSEISYIPCFFLGSGEVGVLIPKLSTTQLMVAHEGVVIGDAVLFGEIDWLLPMLEST